MADLASQAKNSGDRMRSKAKALMEPGFIAMGPATAAKKRTEPGDAQQANAMEVNKRGDSGAKPTPYAKGGSVRKFADGGNVRGEAAFDDTGAKQPPVTLKKGGKAKAKAKKPMPKMPPPMPPDMAAPPPAMAAPPMGAPPMGAGAPPPAFKKGGPMNLKLKKGALHKELGVPQGEKIPKSKISAAADSSNPTLKKRAVFAENAAKWHHAEGGSAGQLPGRKAIKLAVGGVAKIRHNEATPAGKQKPSKGSGWSAYK